MFEILIIFQYLSYFYLFSCQQYSLSVILVLFKNIAYKL